MGRFLKLKSGGYVDLAAVALIWPTGSVSNPTQEVALAIPGVDHAGTAAIPEGWDFERVANVWMELRTNSSAPIYVMDAGVLRTKETVSFRDLDCVKRANEKARGGDTPTE